MNLKYMKIDNFEQIKHLLFNNRADVYYVVYILQRHKDGHEGKEMKAMFPITSYTSFEEKTSLIKSICDSFGARAYITITPRTKGAFMKRLLSLVTEAVVYNKFSVNSIYDKALMTTPPIIKKYIIDVDDLSQKEAILKTLDDVFEVHNLPFLGRESYLYAEIPTVTGCHLIVSPFDKKLFSKDFPNVDIHTNSQGTLLYYGKED